MHNEITILGSFYLVQNIDLTSSNPTNNLTYTCPLYLLANSFYDLNQTQSIISIFGNDSAASFYTNQLKALHIHLFDRLVNLSTPIKTIVNEQVVFNLDKRFIFNSNDYLPTKHLVNNQLIITDNLDEEFINKLSDYRVYAYLTELPNTYPNYEGIIINSNEELKLTNSMIQISSTKLIYQDLLLNHNLDTSLLAAQVFKLIANNALTTSNLQALINN